jgi:hypothetical protein
MDNGTWEKASIAQVAHNLNADRLVLRDASDAIGCFAAAHVALDEAADLIARAENRIQAALINWNKEAA